jgi:Flp pilus assembly pilin Flp
MSQEDTMDSALIEVAHHDQYAEPDTAARPASDDRAASDRAASDVGRPPRHRRTPGALAVRAHGWVLDRDDRGQATTEYALVLLGAALVALLLVAWATGGGGAGKIGRLLDRVLDAVIDKVG